MPMDEPPMLDLSASADRLLVQFDRVAEVLHEFRAGLAMATLPTAEVYVASLPRIHYADHLTTTEEEASEGDS
jgi:hypothetical protein